MDKRSKIIIGIFGLVVFALIGIEMSTPQPVNWSNSFTATDKIPLGSYILYQELQEAKPASSITQVNSTPYTFLSQQDQESPLSNYIFINSTLDFDKQSYLQLMRYVRQGNTVFMAATDFGQFFKDSLGIDTYTDYQLTEEEVSPTFFSPYLTQDSLPTYKKRIYKTVFKSFDTTKTKALGHYHSELEATDEINFIKIQEGKGTLLLNTLPEAYTNYYLLKQPANQYAATTLSFLPHQTYFWDSYKKDGRHYIDSPMRFVLSQKSLQWAYYILGIGVLLYMLFRGKREQRIIPVIPPLQNDTLAFTQTVSDLYRQHEAYGAIGAQKITYFLARIRTQCYLDTTTLDDRFITKLAAKTGHTIADTTAIISFIRQIQQQTQLTEADLIALHKKIDAFTI